MKLTKKLLAMALAGVMLLTILTGCSGGKTGDRLVEEYMATFLSENLGFGDIPITHDVPEIKTVADMFDPSWMENSWKNIPPTDKSTLQEVFSKYKNNVNLYACEVDSKQSELNQAMRVMATMGSGLTIYGPSAPSTAAKCATRLVTREGKSYRIAVVIY